MYEVRENRDIAEQHATNVQVPRAGVCGKDGR